MRYLLLLFVFSLFVATNVSAQVFGGGSMDGRFDRGEEGSLWYGAGAQIGFSGGNFQRFFQIGISPMVGYKFNEFLSAGPRVSVAYNSFRFDFGGRQGAQSANYWTGSAGLFARAKVFRGIFVHGEYSLTSDVFIGQNANGLVENRTTRAVPWLGAGLQQGGGPGGVGFEILLLFRLTQPDRLNDQPFEFRTGFNYNF